MCYFWTKPVVIGLSAITLVVFASVPTKADLATLDSLVNGATLTEGDAFYSNFSLFADDGTISPDYTQIFVETIAGPAGLEFQGHGQFALAPGLESIIFQIGFDVTTSGAAWNSSGVDLSLGVPVAGTEGLVDVFSNISDSSAVFLTSTNATIDPLFGIDVPTDDQPLGGLESALSFETSFTLFSDSAESVSLDSFRITTTSVPEPANAALFAVMVGSLFLSRRRSKAVSA